ncbi:alpha/beta hydrolase [Williamsia sp. 1138]|uniref:alpha/beta fold hydrolase n=1 Tax=Williamsia sp. 1138 TaxID=1903117 RepID=UPI000A11F8DE|nr:alpha/beta hydrolase [Williamsia sp. 1138]OZG28152.1 alpha/beta hydrolase [Williamsia sp. 1138]
MGTFTRRVAAGDGTDIAYRVTGPADSVDDAAHARDVPTLLLIHGWAQSSACWGGDLIDDLAARYRVIAMDLRGHGGSGVPPADRLTSEDFGSDVAAVLAAEVPLGGPVFVLGWSYGGLVICDYLARAGAIAPTGLIFVGAITSIGRGQAGGRVGPQMRAALPDAYSEDPATAVAALQSFAGSLAPAGQGACAQRLLGTSLTVPPYIRAGLFAREAANDALLEQAGLPILLIHGTADGVVDISSAEHLAGLVPGAQARFWDGAGHAPFLDDPGRFVREVDDFLVDVTVSGGVR